MAEKTVFGLDLIIDDLLVETVDRFVAFGIERR